MLCEQQQGPGQHALAGLECRSEQGWYLSHNGRIARWMSVGVGTVQDDRSKVTIVNLSPLVPGPFQQALFEQRGVAHDSAIGCDWKIDPKSECAATPFAFHQPADRVGDQIVVLATSAEQQLNRKASHQAAWGFPNVDRLTDWPGSYLRFGEPRHFFSQCNDAGSAQRRGHELAIMRVLVAGGAGETHAKSSRGRIPGAAGQQAPPPPCCGI